MSKPMKEMIPMTVALFHKVKPTSIVSKPVIDNELNHSEISHTSSFHMPTIPKLTTSSLYHRIEDEDNINNGDEEDEENEEEKKLMEMLIQLKNAKKLISESRKRKHFEKLIEDKRNKLKHFSHTLTRNYQEKCKSVVAKIEAQGMKLKLEAMERQKEMDEEERNIRQSVESHEKILSEQISFLKKAQEETMIHLHSSVTSQTEEEYKIALEQIASKLEELKMLLNRCVMESSKEDRFTKIMNSIIATL